MQELKMDEVEQVNGGFMFLKPAMMGNGELNCGMQYVWQEPQLICW